MSLNSDMAARRKEADKKTTAHEKTMATVYKQMYLKSVSELEKLWAKEGEASSKVRAMLSATKEIQKLYEKASGKSLDETRLATVESYISAKHGLEYAISKEIGYDLSFGLVSEPAIESISKGGTIDIIKTFSTNTDAIKKKIRETIARNLVNGRTIDQVAEDLKGNFNNGYNDAIRVVRTETHRAYSEGELDSIADAESIGIKITKVWSAAGDARDAHAELDGVEADEDGLFYAIDNDGNELSAEGPGLFDAPELSINCRCSLLEIITDEPASYPVDPFESPAYAQWIEDQGYQETYHPGNS
jgi:hypothetical protein